MQQEKITADADPPSIFYFSLGLGKDLAERLVSKG